MKKAIFLISIVIAFTLPTANVLAYEFNISKDVLSSVNVILEQKKHGELITAWQDMGFKSLDEVETLQIADVFPLVYLCTDSLYAGIDSEYVTLNSQYLQPNFNGQAKTEFSSLNDLNLMNEGSSAWFVILKSNIKEKAASMIISIDKSGNAEFNELTGSGDYLDAFAVTLANLERLAEQKGSIEKIVLYTKPNRYLFAATVNQQEWILPVPDDNEVKYESISQWLPEKLWTVDEIVQAYKNQYIEAKAAWLANGKKSTAGSSSPDFSKIPVVTLNHGGNYLWVILPVVSLGLILIIAYLIWQRRKESVHSSKE